MVRPMEMALKTKIKEYINKKGLNVSSEAYEEIDKKIKELLDNACKRAEGNKRKTVKAVDF